MRIPHMLEVDKKVQIDPGFHASSDLEALLEENARKVNIFNARIALVMMVYVMINWIMILLQMVHGHMKAGSLVYGLVLVILAGTAVPVLYHKGCAEYARERLMIGILIACTLIATYAIYGFWGIFVIPILLTCRYYDVTFTRRTVAASYLCLLGGSLLSILLAYKGGYFDVNALIVNRPIYLTGENSIARELLDAGYVTLGQLAEVQLSTFLAVAAMLTVPTIFANSYALNGRHMLQSAMELAEQKERAKLDEKRMDEVETKVAISQIQPHFLYNTLSAIMAIEDNPDETIDALEEFSSYLRENLNTLSATGNIPIAREIEHVKRYIKLEQLRFGEKLKVKYNLHDLDFEIPPLTIQMLAENAIKHGITKKMYGGNLWISSEESDTEHIIRVMDDGVGFDPTEIAEDGNEHIGLDNVSSRIRRWCHGSLEISSAPGVGTTCILHLPKGGKSS